MGLPINHFLFFFPFLSSFTPLFPFFLLLVHNAWEVEHVGLKKV
jgi:hypothetical protein